MANLTEEKMSLRMGDTAPDLLERTAKYSVATPADWKNGDDVIISNTIKDHEIGSRFPKGHKIIKPYFHTTQQPDRE